MWPTADLSPHADTSVTRTPQPRRSPSLGSLLFRRREIKDFGVRGGTILSHDIIAIARQQGAAERDPGTDKEDRGLRSSRGTGRFPVPERYTESSRSRRRQSGRRKQWLDNLQEWIGLNITDFVSVAEDKHIEGLPALQRAKAQFYCCFSFIFLERLW